MNDRIKNSIAFLIVGIILVIFLATYWNMNSYTPRGSVEPCFKFRCDFSGEGNSKLIGPINNLSINWKSNGDGKNNINVAYGTNSPVTDGSGKIFIANPTGYKKVDDKGNTIQNIGVVYSYSSKGGINWTFNNVNGSINTTICVGNYLYFGCDDGYLYALKNDGGLQWKYFVGGNSISSSPTYDINTKNVFIGTINGLVAVDSKGKYLWSFNKAGNVTTCPAINSNYNIIYFTSSDGYLYCISTIDGSLKWKYQAGDAIQSSPAIGPNNTVYFGCNDGYLYAVNPPNSDSKIGELAWKFNTNIAASQITSSPAVDSKGNIYYTCVPVGQTNTLYILQPNGSTLHTFSLSGTTSKSSPLVDSNGNVFIGSDSNLYYIDNATSVLNYITLGGNINSSPMINSNGVLVVSCDDGYLYNIKGDTV